MTGLGLKLKSFIDTMAANVFDNIMGWAKFQLEVPNKYIQEYTPQTPNILSWQDYKDTEQYWTILICM